MQITHNDVSSDGERWVAARRVVHDDGAIEDGVHVFPKDIMEWRAAEYGIDPADRDTLLDIVLVEPYLTQEEWAAGFQLHNAPDIATAQADHIARCAKAKLRLRMTTRGASRSYLQKIRDESPMDPEVIAVKREHVSHLRRQFSREHAQQQVPLTGAERAARLRNALPLERATRREEAADV